MAQEERGESLNRCGKTNNDPARDHRQHHERFSGTGSPSVGLARPRQSETQANDSASQTLISEIGQVPFQSRHPRKARSRRPACRLGLTQRRSSSSNARPTETAKPGITRDLQSPSPGSSRNRPNVRLRVLWFPVVGRLLLRPVRQSFFGLVTGQSRRRIAKPKLTIRAKTHSDPRPEPWRHPAEISIVSGTFTSCIPIASQHTLVRTSCLRLDVRPAGLARGPRPL